MLKLSNIKFKAVMAGALVDNGGTFFVMTLLAVALMSTGLSGDEVMNRMKSTSGLLLGLIIGLGFTALGGYVAGRMAGRSGVIHGALVAVVGMVFVLLIPNSDSLFWLDIVGLAGMIPAGAAGGLLADKRRVRLSSESR